MYLNKENVNFAVTLTVMILTRDILLLLAGFIIRYMSLPVQSVSFGIQVTCNNCNYDIKVIVIHVPVYVTGTNCN